MQKSISKSSPAVWQLHKSAESMSAMAWKSGCKSQFHHPVTDVWAVGGRCWVQSLHWCCWGHVKTSLLLNLLQREWLVGQRNNFNYRIWTQLPGCCPMSSVRESGRKTEERETPLKVWTLGKVQVLFYLFIVHFWLHPCSRSLPEKSAV